MPSKKREINWEANYLKLKGIMQAGGKINSKSQLYFWLQRQKKKYRLGELGNRLAQKLTDIGVDLEDGSDGLSFEQKWNLHLAKQKAGSDDASHKKWAELVRYSRKNPGKKGTTKLTEERIKALNDIGFDWNPRRGVKGIGATAVDERSSEDFDDIEGKLGAPLMDSGNNTGLGSAQPKPSPQSSPYGQLSFESSPFTQVHAHRPHGTDSPLGVGVGVGGSVRGDSTRRVVIGDDSASVAPSGMPSALGQQQPLGHYDPTRRLVLGDESTSVAPSSMPGALGQQLQPQQLPVGQPSPSHSIGTVIESAASMSTVASRARNQTSAEVAKEFFKSQQKEREECLKLAELEAREKAKEREEKAKERAYKLEMAATLLQSGGDKIPQDVLGQVVLSVMSPDGTSRVRAAPGADHQGGGIPPMVIADPAAASAASAASSSSIAHRQPENSVNVANVPGFGPTSSSAAAVNGPYGGGEMPAVVQPVKVDQSCAAPFFAAANGQHGDDGDRKPPAVVQPVQAVTQSGAAPSAAAANGQYGDGGDRKLPLTIGLPNVPGGGVPVPTAPPSATQLTVQASITAEKIQEGEKVYHRRDNGSVLATIEAVHRDDPGGPPYFTIKFDEGGEMRERQTELSKLSRYKFEVGDKAHCHVRPGEYGDVTVIDVLEDGKKFMVRTDDGTKGTADRADVLTKAEYEWTIL